MLRIRVDDQHLLLRSRHLPTLCYRVETCRARVQE
jgi:hypothetical protein